jgi:hypothetical protein
MATTERGAAIPQDAQITPFGTAQKVTGIVRQDVPNGGSVRVAMPSIDHGAWVERGERTPAS